MKRATEHLVFEAQKILLVEGKDEVGFFRALFRKMEITDFQIIDAAGKDNFKTRIKALTILDGFHRVKILGIIRDADENAENAFRSVCDALKSAKLAIPELPGIFTEIETGLKTGIILYGQKYKTDN